MDPVRLALTGALPLMLIVATALAFPVSWVLLRLYRRAVLAAMQRRSGAPPPLPTTARVDAAERSPEQTEQPQPLGPLRFQTLDHRSTSNAVLAGARDLWRARWRIAAVYAIAGLGFSMVMTYGWLFATHDPLKTWAKVGLLVWIYLWPTLLAVNLVAATHTRARVANVAGYFGVYCLLWAAIIERNPEMPLLEVPMIWVLFAGPPTVMLGAFMIRRLRAVGPLTLSFLVLAWAGAFAIQVAFVFLSDAALRRLVDIGDRLGLDAIALLWGPIVIGFVIFALLGWQALRWLARRYERYRVSDEFLQIASIMLLFAVVCSVNLALSGPSWIFTGFIAFACWYALMRIGFAATSFFAARERNRSIDLLLLRVFALGSRSEQFFAGLQRVWLRQGTIALIAGPDLATANVEPHEFLGFVRGHTGDQFIDSEENLHARVDAIEHRTPPDGRHRVHEFFCHADTWQPTMRRLVQESDVVLMDLRAFTQQDQGCLWELGQLLDIIDLRRVIFLVDRTTDRAFLEESLLRLWRASTPASPNRISAVGPIATLFACRRPAERDLRTLLAQLARAAGDLPRSRAPAGDANRVGSGSHPPQNRTIAHPS